MSRRRVIAIALALPVLVSILLSFFFWPGDRVTRSELDQIEANGRRIVLAIRAFKLKQGRYPPHFLNELVPEFLESVPDGVAGESWYYSQSGTDWGLSFELPNGNSYTWFTDSFALNDSDI